mmetsp:Transcript_50376/g.79863  ORF Transcript_50376/g.79863 Transcript_50376/m.79863 type:complete len:143 (-) Transcript_50376:91-519(-)|eukprot:CAMPEP_0169121772 /NCGR_PEP_ID=MMETSP1015-20121227/32852_1 /TAXON_ID=342587 /ORGANISM="Karlodinium micrum, Strain CCMP2283" /LENGTH=142 /DNA_ID=CAMNT_0009184909 /DNA_START=40 /DNA_END=468 /DNA_ORIENTATION=-
MAVVCRLLVLLAPVLSDARWPWESAEPSADNVRDKNPSFLRRYFFGNSPADSVRGSMSNEEEAVTSDAPRGNKTVWFQSTPQKKGGVESVHLDSQLQIAQAHIPAPTLLEASRRATNLEEMVAADRKHDVHMHQSFTGEDNS